MTLEERIAEIKSAIASCCLAEDQVSVDQLIPCFGNDMATIWRGKIDALKVDLARLYTAIANRDDDGVVVRVDNLRRGKG